jgi:hypothetical protein
MACEKNTLLINRSINMYNVTVTTEIRKLDGTAFSKNDQVWSNMPYEGILLLQKVGLEGLSKLLEETEKAKSQASK